MFTNQYLVCRLINVCTNFFYLNRIFPTIDASGPKQADLYDRANTFITFLLMIIMILCSCKQNNSSSNGNVNPNPDQEIIASVDTLRLNLTKAAEINAGIFSDGSKIANSNFVMDIPDYNIQNFDFVLRNRFLQDALGIDVSLIGGINLDKSNIQQVRNALSSTKIKNNITAIPSDPKKRFYIDGLNAITGQKIRIDAKVLKLLSAEKSLTYFSNGSVSAQQEMASIIEEASKKNNVILSSTALTVE